MVYSNLNNRISLHIYCCSHENLRIDAFLAQLPLQLSRSQLKRLCTHIVRNKKDAKLSHTLYYKDELHVFFENSFNTAGISNTTRSHYTSEIADTRNANEIDIIYENKNIIVLNKAKATLVHPGPGHSEQSIAEMLEHKLSAYTAEDLLYKRAGIVHRLDKDTTGTLLIAKTADVHAILSRQFAERLVRKQYLAVVKSCPSKERETVHIQIARHRIQRKKFTVVREGGRSSITEYQVLFSKNNYSVLLFKPHTGRTHQIRVLAQHLGCPIIGDELYSRKTSKFPDYSLQLHALSLSFYNPEDILNIYYRNKKEEQKSLSDLLKRNQCEKQFFHSPVPQKMQDLFHAIGFDSSALGKILKLNDEDVQEYLQDQQRER